MLPNAICTELLTGLAAGLFSTEGLVVECRVFAHLPAVGGPEVWFSCSAAQLISAAGTAGHSARVLSRWDQEVGGTADGRRAAVQDVRVDHRRPDVGMTEQLLDGANIVPGFEEMGGERVAQSIYILLMNRRLYGLPTATIHFSAPRFR